MRRWWAIGAGVALAVAAALWWFSGEEAAPTGVLAEVAAERARRPRPPRHVASRTERPAPVEQEPVEPAEEGPTEVRCAVGDALSGWPVRLFDLEDGQPIDWRIEEGHLVFEAPGPSGEAGLTWGFLRRREDSSKSFARVAWSAVEGAGPSCSVDHLPAALDAAIYGRVRGAERLQDGTVFLEGCGLQERGEPAPIDVDGGFFLQAQSGKCSLRAWRRSGMLRLPGPWIEVDADAAADAEVDLEVPTFEPAGMGIGFQPTDGGVAVNQVHEGTPAAAAGLAPGDVITAIDGAGTEGMDVEEFLLHGIGPAGTDVVLEGTTVDGEPFEIVVRRALIQ